jgi:hypothetical protein
MQNKEEETLKKKNVSQKIFDKIIDNPLKSFKRPPYLPPHVPDCGWNHGEQKK